MTASLPNGHPQTPFQLQIDIKYQSINLVCCCFGVGLTEVSVGDRSSEIETLVKNARGLAEILEKWLKETHTNPQRLEVGVEEWRNQQMGLPSLKLSLCFVATAIDSRSRL
jgi:hypothetical protein